MTTDQYANIMVRLPTRASVDDAWNLVTDWPAQSRWIAFTNVFIVQQKNGAGTRFTGRTKVGPVWFDDPMEVVIWEPPINGERGYCKVRKFGPWILGTAEIAVGPDESDATRTMVTWKETIALRGTPPLFNPLTRAMGGVLFRMTLRKAIAELDMQHPDSHD